MDAMFTGQFPAMSLPLLGLGLFAAGICKYVAYGVFEARHVWLTVGATLPVAAGTWLGGRLRARVDEARFRKALFVLLIVIGANLVRRAVFQIKASARRRDRRATPADAASSGSRRRIATATTRRRTTA